MLPGLAGKFASGRRLCLRQSWILSSACPKLINDVLDLPRHGPFCGARARAVRYRRMFRASRGLGGGSPDNVPKLEVSLDPSAGACRRFPPFRESGSNLSCATRRLPMKVPLCSASGDDDGPIITIGRRCPGIAPVTSAGFTPLPPVRSAAGPGLGPCLPLTPASSKLTAASLAGVRLGRGPQRFACAGAPQ